MRAISIQLSTLRIMHNNNTNNNHNSGTTEYEIETATELWQAKGWQ